MKYDAFISYRHGEIDQFVAEQLHKQLESFRLPKNLVKQRKKQGFLLDKTKITRVFRDRDELPIASDLSDPITKALSDSEFLIVICSKRLLESIWCQREMETFIEMHGRDHVLAVLADDEPKEAFPSILCEEVETQVLENGETKEGIKYIEPLAADVRGCSRKEIKKKIKEEVIRLAAPMFGCGYDELKQRHREQKIKKIIGASVAVAAVCFVFGLASTTMALTIQKQSEVIEAQYEAVRMENALGKAEESNRLLEKGDRIQALEVLQEEMPYTAEEEYAFTNASHIYEVGGRCLPDCMLHHKGNVSFFTFSSSGERLLTVEEYGKITVWEVVTGKAIGEFHISYDYVSNADQTVLFLNENEIVVPTEEGITVFDINQGIIINEKTCGRPYSAILNEKGTRIGVVSYEGTFVYDCTTFEQMAFVEKTDILAAPDFYFENNKDEFFLIEDGDEGQTQITIYGYATEKPISQYTIEIGDCGDAITLNDGNTIFISNRYDITDEQLSLSYESCIAYVDNQNVVWTYELAGKILHEATVVGKKDEYIAVRSYDRILLLARETGKLVEEIPYGQQIVWMAPLAEGSSYLHISLRDGSVYGLNVENILDNGAYIDFHCDVENVKQFERGKQCFAQLSYNSSNVIIYTYPSNPNGKPVLEMQSGHTLREISLDGKMALTTKENQGTWYALETSSEPIMIEQEERIYLAKFAGEHQEFVVVTTFKMLSVYDRKTGELVREISLAKSGGGDSWLIKNQTQLVLVDYAGVVCYDLLTGNVVYEYELEELADLNVFAVGPGGVYMAVSSKQKECIQILGQDGKEAFTIEANASLVRNLFFNETDTSLYVNYADGGLEVYDLESRTCSKVYDTFDTQIRGIVEKENSSGNILYGYSTAYVTNEQGDLTAKLESYTGYAADTYYFEKGRTVVALPEYTYEEVQAYE